MSTVWDGERLAETRAQLEREGSVNIHVVSGSMSPVLPIGAVAELAPVSFETLKKFDMIVFLDEGNLTCHMIWKVSALPAPNGERTVVTRGINSDKFDFPVRESQILGRVSSHRVNSLTILGLKFDDVYLLPCLLVLALALRMWGAGLPSFSLDESSSLLYASFPEWRALFWDNNPALYHVLLKGWLVIFPMDEFWSRALSALISVAGVAAMFAFGKVTGGRRRAWACAILMTFSVFSIRYGQETRMYALFEAATAFHLFCLVRFSRDRNRKTGIWFAISNVVVAGSHLLGIIPVLFGATYLIARDRGAFKKTAFGVTAAIAVFGVTLWFSFHPNFLEWQRVIRNAFNDVYQPTDILKTLGQEDGVIAVMLVALSVAALFSRAHELKKLHRVIFGVSAGLIFFGALVSYLDKRNVFISRYFIFMNPWSVALFVGGLERTVLFFKNQKQRAAAVTAVIFVYAGFFAHAYDYVKPPWRKIAQLAVDHKVDYVLTSAPAGIKIPYYKNAGITVEQFKYSNQFPAHLIELVKTHSRVAIIDNYWGKIQYLTLLTHDLIAEELPFDSFELADNGAETVFMIIIYKRKDMRPAGATGPVNE